MSNFSWRIHKKIIEGREGEVLSLLDDFGDNVQIISGAARPAPSPPFTENGGLALTTIQDARLLLGQWKASPGLYFHIRKYDVSYWLPRIDADIPVLNRGATFCPLGLIPHVLPPLWSGDTPPSNGKLFVRPDSGLKTFPGIAIDCREQQITSWADFHEALCREFRHIPPETMVCIASGREIHPIEWRFWVVDRKVVASTPYAWEGSPCWNTPPDEALDIAQSVAEQEWQVDVAYVVDVVQALHGDRSFYLNEINAASTSGLYNVPIRPLLTAFREASIKELAGELSIVD